MQSVRHFELVRALAEHRNFGRAADALGVSQPSLTRSLKSLEDKLGAPLFDRAGVTPTVFGQIVLRHGRSVLTAFADLTREIEMTRGLETGALTVAMGVYPADISGVEAAARLCGRRSNLTLDLRTTDWSRAREAVLAGDVDLGFADIRVARQDPDLDVEPVRAGPLTFFCAASHPLAARKGVGPDDLMGWPWVGPTIPAPLGAAQPEGILPGAERPCGVFDAATGRFHPRIRIESFAAVRAIVLAGGALSAAFPFQIEADVAAGALALLPTEAPMLTLDYGFIAKRGRLLSPAAVAFMAEARAVDRGRGPA